MSTVSYNPNTIDRQWLVVDVAGLTLGRAAARVASILRGKHKPTYTPHADCGDFVVVVNAEKAVLTGTKPQKKLYQHHTGYMGGVRTLTAEKLLEKRPTALVEAAVKGMLPRGPLGRQMYKKLKVYAGAEHPHQAQQPQTYDLGL
ncbi:MAG: 50S ribosomal protein L13 [Deltaproteobacteria bacterium]|nr:50S ribosomal protein L13 [Deltaproteobacteria bacterium]MCB9787327.1 50S ribosomal protein L13 [Deltaproteobacteria bacterium]